MAAQYNQKGGQSQPERGCGKRSRSWGDVGPQGRKTGSLRSWKNKGNQFSSGTSRKDTQPCPPIFDSWPPELEDNESVLFLTTEFVVICYRSNRKLIHQLYHPLSPDPHLHLWSFLFFSTSYALSVCLGYKQIKFLFLDPLYSPTIYFFYMFCLFFFIIYLSQPPKSLEDFSNNTFARASP